MDVVVSSKVIKRLYEARGKTTPAVVLECLDKIGIINKLRNELLHWGANSDLTVTNAVKALPRRAASYGISPEKLDTAAQDLAKITPTLSNIITPYTGSPVELEAAQEVMNAPWQHKPPSPNNNHRKTQTTPQELSPPRAPSPK